MDLLNETVLLETKSTLFKFLIRETSQFLCYESLLTWPNAFFSRNAILVALLYSGFISSTIYTISIQNSSLPGRVAQSVTCLATDACLTADPGVASSIPIRSHTFVEIDHEMISTVILLPSADSFKKGCCQLQAKVCARITG